MSAKSNQEKTEQLGINFSTAYYRLRKQVLFQLIQRLGENICFRCHTEITDPDDLSFDHKKAWLGVSSELFWDLGNIGFSHVRCNRPDRPSGPMKKIGPKGTAWCSKCQAFLSTKLFGRAVSRNQRKLRGYCNPCRQNMGWDH